MDWTTWGPPFMTVAGGLGVGLVALAFLATDRTVNNDREILMSRRAASMDRLRELDADRSKFAPEDWQREHSLLVRDAAEILRLIDALPPLAKQPFDPRWLLAGGGVVLVCLALLRVLTSIEPKPQAPAAVANPHGEAAPGEAPALPDNLAALHEMTYAAIEKGDLPTAMTTLDKAKKLAPPNDPYVATHLGILRVLVAMYDRADPTFQDVLKAQPDFPRALLWLGISRAQQGNREEARPLLERVLTVAPNTREAAAATQVLAEIDDLKAGKVQKVPEPE